MSLGAWMARNGNRAKDVLGKGASKAALEIGDFARSDLGKDAMFGAALGAPLEAATSDEDEGLGESLGEGAIKGGALNAGTMALLRKLGLG